MRSRGAIRRAPLALVAAATGAVLILTAGNQIYDTNFQTLWEGTALLLGDHPYRDFYEWGLPLQAAVSAAAQLLTGHRLLGEFMVQWIFIIAAMVLSTHLALQLSRSTWAALVAMGLAVVLLAATPTYHYPKLFLYPLAISLAWGYLDDPGVRRAAILGAATAVAFLFRHDHGVYIGVLAVAVFALARAAVPASRQGRWMLADMAAYTGAAAALLVPWLAVVQLSEGVPEYVRSRADLYEEWSASGSPFLSLVTTNPIRMLIAEPPPPPKPAPVTLTWSAGVDPARRADLERQYRLRPLDTRPDEAGRWRYEVPNIYDAGLWRLRSEIENADSAAGFDWPAVERLQQPVPVATRTTAVLWIQEMVLLVPVLLLISAGLDVVRRVTHGTPIPADCFRLTAAAVLLVAADRSLLREATYALAIVPATAAMSAPLIGGRRRDGQPRTQGRAVWIAARVALTAVLLLATSVAVVGYTRGTGVFNVPDRSRTIGPVLSALTTSPAIDGYLPPSDAGRYDRRMWASGVSRDRILLRYLHDCTREGDRILVTGSTPYHVHYYADRSVAGGHVFWHIGWRSDTARQQQLLELLRRQSVPFAYSTHDPVLDDLKRYPLIHEHFSKHYAPLDGSRGVLLVDTRRQPTGQFGQLGFPCFR